MTEDERHEQAIRDMEAARERLEMGQLWVQYPELHEDHPNRMTFEIRGFVDSQVVIRFWMKHRGYFGYEVRSLYRMALEIGIAGKGYGPSCFLAQSQDWAAHGVNPEDDDLVG